MTASRPDPTAVLEGAVVRLRPLVEGDFPALYRAIGRPEVFAGGWGGGSGAYRADYEGWAASMRTILPFGAGNVYAVCRQDDDAVVGTTALAEFDLPNEWVHIGWTAYAPEAWGTAVNADAKRMLLASAFSHGFGRVHLQADAANTRSLAAIERLGARREGTLRRHKRRADGSFRDTVVFSILAEEWPDVEAGLQRRLAAFGVRV